VEKSLLRVVLEELGYYDVSKFFSAIMEPEESMLTFEVTENVRKLLDKLPDVLDVSEYRFPPKVVLQLAKHNPKWLLFCVPHSLLGFIVEHDIQLTQQELEALEKGDSEAQALAQLLRGYEQPTVIQKPLSDFLFYAVRRLISRISLRVARLAYENNVRVMNSLVQSYSYRLLIPLAEPPITTKDVLRMLSKNSIKTAFAYVASPSVDWDVVLPRLKRAYERLERLSYSVDALKNLLWSALFRNRLQDVLTVRLAEMYNCEGLWGTTDPVTEEVIRRMLEKGGEK